VGIESYGEYLDFWSFNVLDSTAAAAAINEALPRGLRVSALLAVASDAPGLSESVRAAHYLARLPDGLSPGRAEEIFAERDGQSVVRRKDGKTVAFPLQVWLHDIVRVDESSFRMALGAGGDGASVRPDEVLTVVYGDAAKTIRLVRLDLAVLWGDQLVSPMLADRAADAVVERAAG
jgi:hypothetical protein